MRTLRRLRRPCRANKKYSETETPVKTKDIKSQIKQEDRSPEAYFFNDEEIRKTYVPTFIQDPSKTDLDT